MALFFQKEERKKEATTELYRINGEHYGYLCYEAENQQLFVAFVLQSRGLFGKNPNVRNWQANPARLLLNLASTTPHLLSRNL